MLFKMKWSEDETVKFVELYRESECLWNVSSPLYKNKHLRQKAIEAIVEDMKKDGFGVQEAKQKIKNIRSTFNQEMLKVKKSTKSGAGSTDVYIPTLKWFTILEPIMKSIKGGDNTATNLETENVDEETEVNKDKGDSFDFDQPESANDEEVADVSQISLKISQKTKQDVISKPKPPKRKLQELSHAVKELKTVSEILAQNPEPEEDEIEIFGKYVSKSLKKLSARDAICAQQEIQGILTKYRLGSMRPPTATSSYSFVPEAMENNISSNIGSMRPPSANSSLSFITDSMGNNSSSNDYEMEGTGLLTLLQ